MAEDVAQLGATRDCRHKAKDASGGGEEGDRGEEEDDEQKGREAMTERSAIIELLERQLDDHVEKMREASKIISGLRRQVAQDNEVIASLAAEIRARETTYVAIVEEIRKLMVPLSETSDPEKIAALRRHWKDIEETLSDFLDVGEREMN